jgi:hypothetical protein
MRRSTIGFLMMLPLSVILEEQVSTMNAAVLAEPVPASSMEDDEAWFLRRFWLRVRAKAGVEIPGFAKLQVIPETEMLWERTLPEGWKTFKP